MKKFKFDVDMVRDQFPAMARTVNGYPAAYLDGPGGTQVPICVVEKINEYLYFHNANSHGVFATSKESDAILENAREVFADFFNCSPSEVVFGQSTTTNNFMLAMGLVRTMKPGDEVLITDIDHEGNRSPWRTLEDFGIKVRSVRINTGDITLDFEDFKSKLSEKTKVLAINWAANSCGTVTDVKKYIDEAHKVGALTVVDAVHYAPHKPIDVKAIGTDFLLCSAYKFCGPHLGVLYANREAEQRVKTLRVMADDNTVAPWRFETGTLPASAVSGAAEAVEFLARIGEAHADMFTGELEGLTGRRRNVVAAMLAIDEYEEGLAFQLRNAFRQMEGLKLWGVPEGMPRTSTVSFTVEGENAEDIAAFLAKRGIFVWAGDFYAIETINNVLGLGPEGGFLRIGLAPYTIQSEIDRVICAVEDFMAGKPA